MPLAHPTGTRDHVPGRFAGATRRRLPDRDGSPVLDRAGVGLVEASPDQLGRAEGRWPVLPQSRLATGHRRGARRARRGPHRLQHEFPRQDLCLFAITEHLRSRFWSLAQGGLGGSAEGDDWFPHFARELAEFARFKGLPLSPSCTFDLKVSQAGQPSTRIDAAAGDARLAGLDLDRPDSGLRPLGGINLGDEPTGLVILNLGPASIRERLAATEPPEASPATPATSRGDSWAASPRIQSYGSS